MRSTNPNLPHDLPSPAAVYLLQRRDGLRFKIGWAFEPAVRVQRLPEFHADELDLRGSHAVWLPTVTRAQQFERALHRGLATYRVAPGHAQEGHTEWFLPTAHPTAIRLIRQMPMSAEVALPPPVVAFLSEPKDHTRLQAGDANSAVVLLAQDTLWVMEDLLMHVASSCAMRVDGAGDRYTIRLVNFKGQVSGALETLRWAVLDIDRYRWRADGQTGSFVQLMEFDDDDLVLRLTPMRRIRTWAEGAIVWQVMALMERLRVVADQTTAGRRAVKPNARFNGKRQPKTASGARRGTP